MNVHGELSDLRLLEKLKQNDTHAYAMLYDRYWPALWRYAANAMNDRDDAKDIVQEVFTILWERRHDIYIHSSFSSFLYRVTMNKVIDNISKTKRYDAFYAELGRQMEAGEATADSVILEQEMIKTFEEGLERIPKKARQVFELRRNDELSYQQISEAMNISRETVRSQMKVALKVLKKSILFFSFLSC